MAYRLVTLTVAGASSGEFDQRVIGPNASFDGRKFADVSELGALKQRL